MGRDVVWERNKLNGNARWKGLKGKQKLREMGIYIHYNPKIESHTEIQGSSILLKGILEDEDLRDQGKAKKVFSPKISKYK